MHKKKIVPLGEGIFMDEEGKLSMSEEREKEIEEELRAEGVIPIGDKLKILKKVVEHPDTNHKEKWKILMFMKKYILGFDSKKIDFVEMFEDLDKLTRKYIYE